MRAGLKPFRHYFLKQGSFIKADELQLTKYKKTRYDRVFHLDIVCFFGNEAIMNIPKQFVGGMLMMVFMPLIPPLLLLLSADIHHIQVLDWNQE